MRDLIYDLPEGRKIATSVLDGQVPRLGDHVEFEGTVALNGESITGIFIVERVVWKIREAEGRETHINLVEPVTF